MARPARTILEFAELSVVFQNGALALPRKNDGSGKNVHSREPIQPDLLVGANLCVGLWKRDCTFSLRAQHAAAVACWHDEFVRQLVDADLWIYATCWTGRK